MTAATARAPGVIVVLEAEPDWGPELARQFVDRDVIAVTPSTDTGRELADELPPREIELLVIDAALLRQCTAVQMRRLLKSAARHTLVCLDRADPGGEWQWRDLGAEAVVDPGWTRGEVLASCRRLLESTEQA